VRKQLPNPKSGQRKIPLNQKLEPTMRSKQMYLSNNGKINNEVSRLEEGTRLKNKMMRLDEV